MRWLLVIFLSESRGTLKSTWLFDVRHAIYVTHMHGSFTHADEDALALEIDVGNRQLVGERHDVMCDGYCGGSRSAELFFK